MAHGRAFVDRRIGPDLELRLAVPLQDHAAAIPVVHVVEVVREGVSDVVDGNAVLVDLHLPLVEVTAEHRARVHEVVRVQPALVRHHDVLVQQEQG